MVKRRDVLKGVVAGGILAPFGAEAGCEEAGQANCEMARYKRFYLEDAVHGRFRLGVASGDPTTASVVLWTRLIEEGDKVNATAKGGLGNMPDAQYEIKVHVGRAHAGGRVVQAVGGYPKSEMVDKTTAYALHHKVTGLQAGTTYWYQFEHAGKFSRLGRTKTIPTSASSARFAFISCQQAATTLRYAGFKALAEEQLDFVVHLGDSVYPFGTINLANVRNYHALYRADANARLAWAMHPFFTMWDDHEHKGDSQGVGAQAFHEHMPMDVARPSNWKGLRIYRGANYGGLIDLSLLDVRKFRVLGTPRNQHHLPDRTILGKEQMDWLLDQRLGHSNAHWNVIGSPMLMSGGGLAKAEAWAGFLHDRWKVLDHISRNKVPNAIVISGDSHMTFVGGLLASALGAPQVPYVLPEGTPAAVEFNGTPISSPSPYYGDVCKANLYGDSKGDLGGLCTEWEPAQGLPVMAAGQPPTVFAELAFAGYNVCEVDLQRWVNTTRILRRRSQDTSKAGFETPCMTTLAAFSVESGISVPVLQSGFVPWSCDIPPVPESPA